MYINAIDRVNDRVTVILIHYHLYSLDLLFPYLWFRYSSANGACDTCKTRPGVKERERGRAKEREMVDNIMVISL